MKPLLFVCWLLPLMLAGQTEKSIHPVNSSASSPQGATYAVVIGISDYEDPKIPDLRFADRDAEAFYHWLHDPQGCALPDSNLQLLTNQKATTAQMIMAMDWLIERCKPGDQAFLFFSGHGDVERITQFQRGYLLSYNSPPAVYGAGAFSLAYLQDIITTLSDKGVQVFVITDACRAGKLAGSNINGAQVTSIQLAHQFANEIKILSCQPEEFSLESEQWGGGRGCFSYHLEDALYGFADENHDARVDLRELRRYLEDHVSKEAAPQNQSPMVMGPAQTTLATVQESALSARKTAKGKSTAPFLDIDTKGMESFLLAKSDSSTRRLYARFLAAIDSGQLLSPPGRSADDYFRILLEKPEMASLHGVMKRKLAAALMDEGQTVVNKILKTDPEVLDNIWSNRVNYDHLPAYFQRAAEILGEGHYVYKDLKSKEYIFKSMTVRAENYPNSNVEWLNQEKRRLLHISLNYDSSSAVAYYLLGFTYSISTTATQKAIEQYQKAVLISPEWALIHSALGGQSNPNVAIFEYKKAIELDSNFIRPYSWIAWKYDELGQIDSATYWRKRCVQKFYQKIELDSSAVMAFEYNIAGNTLWQLREYDKAKTILLRGEKISGGRMMWIYMNLIPVYADLLDFENAIHAAEKTVTVIKSNYNYIGSIYFFLLKDPNKALDAYLKAGQKFDGDQIRFHLLTGNYTKAFAQAKILMQVGSEDTLHFYDETYKVSYFYYFAAEAARQMNMPDTAKYYYQKIVSQASPELKRNIVFYPNYLYIALSYARLGKVEALHSFIETIKEKLADDPWMNFYLACVYAQTQQEQDAIEFLEKAFELGWQPNPLYWLQGTLCDPMLYPICEHEPFKNLVRQHFPKYYEIATRIPEKQ